MRAGWGASAYDGCALWQLDGWWLHAAIYEAGAELGLARARDGAWHSQGQLMMSVRLPAAAELRGISGSRHAGRLERICL